jgi:anaphase-promoting complex subunit 1
MLVSLFSDGPEPLIGFESPLPIFSLLETVSAMRKTPIYPTLDAILPSQASVNVRDYATDFTPRIKAILLYFSKVAESKSKSHQLVEAMISSGIDTRMGETFPEALLAIFKEPIVQCQANPPTIWSDRLLTYVSREDLNLRTSQGRLTWTDSQAGKVSISKLMEVRN